MRRALAFLLGIIEARSLLTSGFDTFDEYEAYDTGRELFHRVTRRRFEP